MTEFECKRCGKCCEAVCMRFLTEEDFDRIMRWLEQEENWGKTVAIATIENMPGYYSFGLPASCTQYDHVTKQCKIYEARPSMCREYPNGPLAIRFSGRRALEQCPEFGG